MASPHIQYRAVGQEDQLVERTILPPDLTTQQRNALLSGTAARDGERYYSLLPLILAQMEAFEEAEALLMVDAMNGTRWETQTMRYFRAHIEESLSDGLLAEKWQVDRTKLQERLRRLSMGEVYAVVDAIERVWSSVTYHVDDLTSRVRAVGLVRDRPVTAEEDNSQQDQLTDDH